MLSACQTGTGTRPGGDELLGLARGLLAAGVRTTVVSLWPVDDRATAVLMERFHAAYRRGSDAASALRTVSTAPPAPRRPADPGSPGLWAPFILIGRG